MFIDRHLPAFVCTWIFRAVGSFVFVLGSFWCKPRHKVHPPIGPYMMERIKDFFNRHGEACSVKYIDPSYMIR